MTFSVEAIAQIVLGVIAVFLLIKFIRMIQ